MINFSLPAEVLEIINRIEAAGFEAWCVGGCVRDMLRGAEPDDFDLASNAPSEMVLELFERVIPTGLKHGTVTVLINQIPFEITRYRIDGEYTDSRRPDSVKFTENIENDLSRRDFTINAIAYHPERGLFDPFGGEKDIKKGVVRTVGEADKRFSEDALRIFRAIRFSAKLGFKIEESTLNSVIKNAESLKAVSAERIATELLKTLTSDAPSSLEALINAGGLESFGINKAGSFKKLDEIPKDEMLRFSALCILGKSEAPKTADKLRFSNIQKRKTEEFFALLKEEKLSLPFIKANCKSIGLQSAKDAAKAWGIIHSINSESLEKEIEKAIADNHPYLPEHLEISGRHIKALGFSGEEIGAIQRALLDMVREDPSLNEKECLKKLAKNFRKAQK